MGGWKLAHLSSIRAICCRPVGKLCGFAFNLRKLGRRWSRWHRYQNEDAEVWSGVLQNAWPVYPTIIRAVYPEHNQSSILTLSVPKWQVPTQKQNDPTDDASATRSDRGNRGTSYPCLDWIKTTRTMSLQIPVTVSLLLLVVLLFISSTYSTCGLLCTVSVSGCISTI